MMTKDQLIRKLKAELAELEAKRATLEPGPERTALDRRISGYKGRISGLKTNPAINYKPFIETRGT